MSSQYAKIQYRGSLFWLIFWFILFFPIALVLLLTNSVFELNHTRYHILYNGSIFWLCFWTLAFFPITFLLLFVNGCSVHMETPETFSHQDRKYP